MRSRYKNSKRQNFLLELTASLRVYLFFANIIGKWFLMRSRYKKFKEAEFFNELTGFIVEVLDTKNSKRQNFFTRTDTVTSSLFFLK